VTRATPFLQQKEQNLNAPDPAPPPVRIVPLQPGEEGYELATVGMERDGTPLNIFTTLARNPKLMRKVNSLGGYLLWKSPLPPRQREIVILRTAWRSGSEYEFGQHRVIGAQSGLTLANVDALAASDPGPGWSAEEQALIALTDELCTTCSVSDATWAAVMAGRDDGQRMELLFLVGFYRMLAGFLNSSDVALEADVHGWPVAR
jgi:4-carboxymuconolactone decarboxylase